MKKKKDDKLIKEKIISELNQILNYKTDDLAHKLNISFNTTIQVKAGLEYLIEKLQEL